MLFKEFGGVDALPICLATKDPDEIVATVEGDRARSSAGSTSRTSRRRAASRSRGGCATQLDIPVFHDDQHGTAIVVLAALLNALRVVGKRLEDVRVVVTGRRRSRRRGDADAARRGRRATSSAATGKARIHAGRDGPQRRRSASSPQQTNPRGLRGTRRRRARRGRRLHRALRPGAVTRGRRSASMAAGRDRVRDGEPDARGRCPRRSRSASPWSRPAAPTTRTRSTTCSPSPASSAARSTSAPRAITEGMKLAAAASDRRRSSEPDAARGGLRHPERLQPRRRAGGRSSRRCRGRA